MEGKDGEGKAAGRSVDVPMVKPPAELMVVWGLKVTVRWGRGGAVGGVGGCMSGDDSVAVEAMAPFCWLFAKGSGLY